ncbi:MAG: YceI family protein [Deltaproteobacteria bacterium]|nr:YceI family protein [Deltaproteobacteria bacterium]
MTTRTRFFLATALAAALPLAGASSANATHKIDPVHTYVMFKVLHIGAAYNWGRFNDISGSISLNTEKPEASAVDFTIKPASVDTNNAKRDDHLRGPDFFLAKQFPNATFKSRSVKKSGDKTWDVSGDLTIRGVTKPLSFTFTEVGRVKNQTGKEVVGGHTTFTIKRSDFGVNYGIPNIADEVELHVSVEAIAE